MPRYKSRKTRKHRNRRTRRYRNNVARGKKLRKLKVDTPRLPLLLYMSSDTPRRGSRRNPPRSPLTMQGLLKIKNMKKGFHIPPNEPERKKNSPSMLLGKPKKTRKKRRMSLFRKTRKNAK